MRIFVTVFLLIAISPVEAITKCELNEKITYKKGSCPKNATTKILIKDKYIDESQLQKQRALRDQLADKAYKKEMTRWKRRAMDDVVAKEGVEPSYSTDRSKFVQLQSIEEFKKTVKVYSPSIPNDLSEKLQEMERQVEQRNQALKKLQADR